MLKHKRWVIGVFAVFTLLCALCIPAVNVNYDLASYLPEEANSSEALELMQDVYGTEIPNTRLYAQGISIPQAQTLASNLADAEGVSDVLWLGSQVDMQQPLEVAQESVVSQWKTDEGYLYQLTIDEGTAAQTLDSIKQLASQAGATNVALSGNAVTTVAAQESTSTEIMYILLMAVAIIIIIISLTSKSWFEPVIFLLVLAMAILMNMGTNIIKGEISFITQICAAVLQLAVSMDYAIVMLHTFRRYQAEYPNDPIQAMTHAMHKGFSVVLSSAAVTFFGFLSLSVMSFEIGVDMGVVLAKGIFFSFISVMFLMPCIILACLKPLARFEHKPLMPSFNKFGVWCTRLMVPLSLVVVLLAVPAFLGQDKTSFTYGAAGMIEPESAQGQQEQLINDTFGSEETWIMLIPQGAWAEERQLVDELKTLPKVSNVISYVATVGEQVPTSMVPAAISQQLLAGDYSRIVIQTSLNANTGTDYNMVETVRNLGTQYFGEECYLAGSQVSEYDLKTITTSDSGKVKLFSIGAIALVLMLMFRSISIPLIVLLPIEISIWLNLAVPYFTGQSLNYIGYLVIDAVQLGAAVDYAIIYTREYLEQRKQYRPLKAAQKAISGSALTIMTSALILTIAGLAIYFIASNAIISEIGMLVGRGAFLAMLMMFTVLPLLFVIADWIVRHTSLGLKFYTQDPSKTVKEHTMGTKKASTAKTHKGLGGITKRVGAGALSLVLVSALLPASTLAYAAEPLEAHHEQTGAIQTDAQTVSQSIGQALQTTSQAAPHTMSSATASQSDAYTSVNKEEVVYIKLSQTGAPQGIYVVNSFSNPSNTTITIDDPGTYERVSNLSTTSNLDCTGGVTRLIFEEADFAYQGDLPSNTALPWNIALNYTLDGKEVQESQLAGATGRLGIEVTIEAASQDSIFAQNYLLQGTGSFNSSCARNVTCEGGSVATAGNAHQVTFMVIPGSDASYTIEADVNNLSFDGFTIAGIPLSFALDVDSLDTSELSEATSQLQDAVAQLDEGASALNNSSELVGSALNTLAGTNSVLTNGSSQVQAGMSSVETAATQLSVGSSSFTSGLTEQSATAANLASYYEGLAAQSQLDYAAGMQGVQTGLTNAQQALEDAQTAAQAQNQAALATALNTLAQELGAAGSSAQGVQTAVGSADAGLVAYQAQAAGYAASAQTLTATVGAYAPLGTGIDTLNTSLPQLTYAYGLFDQGLAAYTSGVDVLNQNYSSFNTGVQQLSAGTSEFAAQTATLDQDLLEGIKTQLEQKLNPEFELCSFVDESNTAVDKVQFVFMTTAIEESVIVEEPEETVEEETAWTRLLALFS